MSAMGQMQTLHATTKVSVLSVDADIHTPKMRIR
jgi:hypothetical protein